MSPSNTPAPADPKKALRSLFGVLLGILFVALYYPGIFLLACLVAKAAPAAPVAQILLGVLGTAVLFPFFWLGRRLTGWLACGRNAFPAGAFLAADALLLAIPLCDLLNAARLLQLAGGDKALAQQYAKNCAVLIFALVLLVVAWLITVFWGVFKRFRAMSEALERELAAARAASTAPGTSADTAAAPTTAVSSPANAPAAENAPGTPADAAADSVRIASGTPATDATPETATDATSETTPDTATEAVPDAAPNAPEAPRS